VNNDKIKSTILVAIFVSIASQIHFSVFSNGFIVALSVLIMAIFMYLLENVTPTYIAICSGIFSPLIRMIFLMFDGESLQVASYAALPDMVFFFTYAICYPLVYKFVIKEERNLTNYPSALFLCDFLSTTIYLWLISLTASKELSILLLKLLECR